MAVMTGMAVAGAAASAYGAKEKADAQKDAAKRAAQAAEFRPFDVYGGPSGNITFQGDDSIRMQLTRDQAAQRQALGDLFNQRASGRSPTSGFQQFATGLGTGAIPGLFQGAQAAQQQLPTGAFAQQQGLTGNLSDLAGRQARGLLSQAGQNQNADLASLLSGQGVGATGQALSGLQQGGFDPTQAQNFLQDAAGVNLSSTEGMLNRAGRSIDPSQARGLLSQAQGAASDITVDPSQVMDERLRLLRDQAAPREERQLESLENRLFSQGRLDSTGGDRAMESFARGLGQADLQRQVEAQNLGLQAQQQAANIGLNQAGTLRGLAGTAQDIGTSTAGALGSLAGQRGNLALSEAGLFGDLAGQAAGMQQTGAQLGLQRAGAQADIGQGLLGQAQGLQGLDLQRQGQMLQAGQGLLSLGSNISSQRLQGATDFSNLRANRANQRLSQAQQLFGFGQQLGQQDLNTAMQALEGQQAIDNQLRNLASLGGNMGGQSAQAQAVQSRRLASTGQSPVGDLLGGVGQGLFSSAMTGGGSSGGDGLQLMNTDFSNLRMQQPTANMPSFTGGGG